MRGLYLLLIVILLGSGGCERWKLKQPAYLNLSWKFHSTSSSQGNFVVNKGYFYSTQFTVSGKRAKGSDVKITQNLSGEKIQFSGQTDLGLSLDIPMGDYIEFDISALIDNSNHPCMRLEGTFYKGGSVAVPMIIEWSNYEELSFKIQNPFSLERKKNYKVFIGFDAKKLFENVPSSLWSQPFFTMENGVPTLLINSPNGPNGQLFSKITEQLPKALILTVE